MNTDTDLHLIFKNAAGKKVILKIENPKAGVTNLPAAIWWKR